METTNQHINSPHIFYSGKKHSEEQPKGSKVVIIIPQIRIPRNLYCEVDEGTNDRNHSRSDYKPHQTWSPPGYGDDD